MLVRKLYACESMFYDYTIEEIEKLMFENTE